MIGPMPVYFAYGSNMSSERLRARVGPAVSLGAVRIDHYDLAFNKPGSDGTGKANLVPRTGEQAWGVAWELDDSSWTTLDRFEPRYERALFRLETASGASLEATAYVFEGPADSPHIAPAAAYVQHLVAGAIEHALPADYVERIRALAGLR